jgi:hypothetical protein
VIQNWRRGQQNFNEEKREKNESHRPKRRVYKGNCPSELSSARRNIIPERGDQDKT